MHVSKNCQIALTFSQCNPTELYCIEQILVSYFSQKQRKLKHRFTIWTNKMSKATLSIFHLFFISFSSPFKKIFLSDSKLQNSESSNKYILDKSLQYWFIILFSLFISRNVTADESRATAEVFAIPDCWAPHRSVTHSTENCRWNLAGQVRNKPVTRWQIKILL